MDVPDHITVVDQLVEKTLKNGMLIEVYLVKTPRQYEAALFIGGHFKAGPPLPRPVENPATDATYWMGVRPKVGLTTAEAEEIFGAVNVQNKMNHHHFVDKWGTNDDDDDY